MQSGRSASFVRSVPDVPVRDPWPVELAHYSRLTTIGTIDWPYRLASGGSEARTPAEKRNHLYRHRASGISVSRGCELMGLSRSTFYNVPPVTMTPSEVLIRISAICDEFECYGYRRV